MFVVCGDTPVIIVPQRLSQEFLKLKANLGYTMLLCIEEKRKRLFVVQAQF